MFIQMCFGKRCKTSLASCRNTVRCVLTGRVQVIRQGKVQVVLVGNGIGCERCYDRAVIVSRLWGTNLALASYVTGH